MNREQLITRIKSVIYQNDNNEIDAQKHQDLEIEVVNTLLDAVASVTNGFLGTIRSDAPAPTPQKNGYYIFATSGAVSWIAGNPTVKVGDWLSVTYVGLNHTYSNVDKLLNLSDSYTISDSNIGASLKALYDGLSNLSQTLRGDTTLNMEEIEDKATIAIVRLDGVDISIKNIGRLCNIFKEDAGTARLRVNSALRRRGFQLERLDNQNNFITEKYVGATFEDAEWIKESNWKAFVTSDVIASLKGSSTKSLSDIETDYNTKIKAVSRRSVDFVTDAATTRKQIVLSDRMRNFELSYSGKTEVYTGSTFTDTEWIKDSNWTNFETQNNKNSANGYVGLDANKRLANEFINTNFRKGFGYLFDGVDDYLSIAHNDKLNFGTNDFTLQINCVLSPSTKDEKIFQKVESSAPYTGISMVKGVDNILRFRLFKATSVTSIDIMTITQNNTILNLFCVRNNGLLKIYNNGILIKSIVETVIESINNNQPLSVGASSSGSDKLTGKIGLVRLFNRALSQSDVTYYENNGRPDLVRLQYQDVITDYGELMQGGDNETALKGSDIFEGSTGLVGTYTRNNISPINGLYDARLQVTSVGAIATRPSIGLSIANKAGKSYLLSFKSKVNSGTATIYGIGKGIGSSIALNKTLTDGINKIIFDGSMQSNLTSFYLYFDGTKLFDVQLDDFSVIQLGCVLELLPENALPTQWLDSANSLNAITSGNPAINTETPVTDYSIVDNVTNNIAIGTANRDYVLPAGYIVDSVCVNSTVALTALQLVNITTTETLLTGKTVSASANKHLPITADQSSSKVDSTIRLNCVGNTGLGFNIVINIKKCV